MFTPGQVSEMLTIPPSSLRRYAKIFADRLSPNARKRNRMYTDQDILTLRKVRDLAHEGLTVDEIKPRLDVVTDIIPAENALASLPNVLHEFESIQSRITAQADQLETMGDELAALRAEVAELRRPWWDRLRRKG